MSDVSRVWLMRRAPGVLARSTTTIALGWYGNSPLILGVGVLCSVFDLVYIGLLWRARQPGAARG